MQKSKRRIPLMGIEVDNVTLEEAVERVGYLAKSTLSSYVVTPNVDHIVRLQTDGKLKKAYDGASLVLADGMPLIWISKLYRTPIKEKVSGSDLFPKLCEFARDNNLSMFFLGAAEGVAERAKENLQQRFPGLDICGCFSPEYGFEKDPDKVEEVLSIVRKASPDILIVALGCPKQEVLMSEHCSEMGVPVSLGLGASLDFEAGQSKRAPKWMQQHGLEWLYRMCAEPKRLVKRYLIDDAKIILIAWKYRPKEKCASIKSC